MGIRTTDSDPVTALYDSVSGFAFGPTFEDSEHAEAFLAWYAAWPYSNDRDLRTLNDEQWRNLMDQYGMENFNTDAQPEIPF